MRLRWRVTVALWVSALVSLAVGWVYEQSQSSAVQSTSAQCQAELQAPPKIHQVTSPSGKKYEVVAPSWATPAQVRRFAVEQQVGPWESYQRQGDLANPYDKAFAEAVTSVNRPKSSSVELVDTCIIGELANNSEWFLSPAQERLKQQARSIREVTRQLEGASMVFAIAGSIALLTLWLLPLAWYFALARLAEIAAAVRPPKDL